MNEPTRRSHRIAPFTLVLVTAAVLLASCGGGSGSDGARQTGLRSVRVMLDWTPNTNHAGMYLAKANGYYRRAGLKVTFLQPGQGSDPNQAVGAGTVDFGVSASEQLVPARAAGVPVVSIAAIIQHNTSSLVTLTASGIKRPRDLQGHTYGAYGGTFEKALIDQLVTCDGGDPAKVRFTQVGDADYRQGLTSGHYDAVWIFDGWDLIRMRDLDHLAVNRIPVVDPARCIPDWYTPILVTSDKLISSDPTLVRSFLSATAKGYRQAMAHPQAAAAALLDGAPGLDKNLVERSARYLAQRYASNPREWGRQDPAVWNRFVDFLIDHGITKRGFDTASAYTNAFLPSTS